MNIRLAEIVRNRLVVLFLLFFCSRNKYPDRDGAGTGEDRSDIIPHGSAGKVGVGIFGNADHQLFEVEISRKPETSQKSILGK